MLLGIALPIVVLPLTALSVDQYQLDAQKKTFIDRIGYLVIRLREAKGSGQANCGRCESKIRMPRVSGAMFDYEGQREEDKILRGL